MATAILASGESFSAFWQAAFEEYLKDTKRNGRFDVESLRGIKSVEELATHLHDSSQAFQEFRSKQRRVWDALRLFANPLVTTMKLATASAAGEAIGLPAAVVLGACVYLIKVSDQPSLERITLVGEQDLSAVARLRLDRRLESLAHGVDVLRAEMRWKSNITPTY